jgi:steroid delta-isomerase-like uncharacterized protein
VDALTAAQSYFDAWNAHDPEAIAACFAPGGTYTDPNLPDGADALGTAQYAGGLFASFPDLHFDVESKGLTDDGIVAAQWLMGGTNSRPFQGLPPTEKTIALPGADFIRVGEAGIESVRGYFDGGTMVRQLGLDVVVQPSELGPFRFGVSSYVAGKDVEPGAISVTVLHSRNADETQQVRELSREVVKGLLEQEGFVGWIGSVVAGRMVTLTAWETPAAVEQLRTNEAHNEAMKRFFGSELASGAQTGVWSPHHLNGMWVRCDSCGEMVRASADGSCSCGAQLPDPPRWL